MAESSDSILSLDIAEVEQNNNSFLLEKNLNERENSLNNESANSKDLSSELTNCAEFNLNNITLTEFPKSLDLDKVEETNNLQATTDASQSSDSGIHDSDNNITESSKLIDFTGIELNLSNRCGEVINNFENECDGIQIKDEEFHDAVQFFKDPTSLTYLENAGTTVNNQNSVTSRSSLYVNFDPLHAKFNSQCLVKTNELEGITESDVEPEVREEKVETTPAVVNSCVTVPSVRESIGNVLISFDSPVKSKNEPFTRNIFQKPEKLYTEDELQQALKIQELTVQEAFLKRQHDFELDRTNKEKEMENTIQKLNGHCFTFRLIIEQLLGIASASSENEKQLKENLQILKKENESLNSDYKQVQDDLQKFENTFSDFHKRYEQCKEVVKKLQQNIESMKKEMENKDSQIHEKEEMYNILRSRTQEIVDKANTEVANAKKSGDAQIAVLRAQLKKSEMKITTLENDLNHVKVENEKLSNICDELMAKVSET